jgi:hypothetical protein
MSWFDEARARLAAQRSWGYAAATPAATEPAALAALALQAAGRPAEAAHALDWLTTIQNADGSLGVDAEQRQPCWPTGWAVVAWQTAITQGDYAVDRRQTWGRAAAQAVAWAMRIAGRALDDPNESRVFGHDTTLHGWPWVEATHSWVEPTAIQLLALRNAGQAAHPRCREAVRLLLDRQLPNGGWNYGNTTVLGNTLRPHVQPTGLALAALASEPEARSRVQPSLDYLQTAIGADTATASLCYALLGLAAFDARPAAADAWLAAAYRRAAARGPAAYLLALLLLASLGPLP